MLLHHNPNDKDHEWSIQLTKEELAMMTVVTSASTIYHAGLIKSLQDEENYRKMDFSRMLNRLCNSGLDYLKNKKYAKIKS